MPELNFIIKDSAELKVNPYNLSIYGSEPTDWDLVNSIKQSGLLEPLVIKQDDTVISGHRRLKALQFLKMDAPCRIQSFENEDDEQLAIIEYNRQREKNTKQIYNESKVRKRILEKESRIIQEEAGEFGSEGGRGNKKDETLLPNLAKGFDYIDNREKIHTRDILSNEMKIPKMKLDTILELGELEETGKSKEVRRAEKNIERIEEKIRAGDDCKFDLDKLDELKTKIKENDERDVQNAPVIKEVAREVMKELDNDNLTYSGAREIIKVVNQNPEAAKEILEAKKEAPDKTVQQIMDTMPHVAFNAGNNEWYTPKDYITSAYAVMGQIDLDPASSEKANEIVKATNFYTALDDGLTKQWAGKIWMNPPYSAKFISGFCEKLSEHFKAKEVTEAIVLVNNATETEWFNTLVKVASAVVFPNTRLKFWSPDGKLSSPLQGQAVIYLGDNPKLFIDHFTCFGWGATI